MHQRAVRVLAGLVAAGSTVALAVACSSEHDAADRSASPSATGPSLPGGPSAHASTGSVSPSGGPGGTPTATGGGRTTSASGGTGGSASGGTSGTNGGTSGGKNTSSSSAAPCAAGDLRLAQRPGSSAAGGTVVVAIGLTNASHHTCTVRGYPDLTVSGASGGVPATVRHGGDFPTLNAPVTTVTVKPAARTGFLLAYLNRPTSASGSCTTATSMALRWGSASVTGPVRISVCGSALRISPYRTAAELGT